jgi:diaminopimelate epimerase
MRVPYVKMSGAGNSMVLVDHRARFAAGREEDLARLACDPVRGADADALLLLEPDDGAEFLVRFFNPDGGEYGLCGNGSRCVPFFAAEIGLPGPRYVFRSLSGRHVAERTGPDSARVSLTPVRDLRFDVPVELEGAPAVMDWGDIGVPHGVYWVEDVDRVPIERWGPHLRRQPAFGPAGTNVSFLEAAGRDVLRIRTFERGVEGETLACGSGSAVAATIARARGRVADRVELRVRSGATLVIHLPETDGADPPELEGPVERCGDGELDLIPADPVPAPDGRIGPSGGDPS